MLTKKQRIKLIMLTGHEKFGQMLADAYDSWTRKEYKPCRETMGLDTNNVKVHTSVNKCCCLQGAALIDKECLNITLWGQSLPYRDIEEYYSISYINAELIRTGFDRVFDYTKDDNRFKDNEAFHFGRKVNKIIFGF